MDQVKLGSQGEVVSRRSRRAECNTTGYMFQM